MGRRHRGLEKHGQPAVELMFSTTRVPPALEPEPLSHASTPDHPQVL